jgi:hypothetical protein
MSVDFSWPGEGIPPIQHLLDSPGDRMVLWQYAALKLGHSNVIPSQSSSFCQKFFAEGMSKAYICFANIASVFGLMQLNLLRPLTGTSSVL